MTLLDFDASSEPLAWLGGLEETWIVSHLDLSICVFVYCIVTSSKPQKDRTGCRDFIVPGERA